MIFKIQEISQENLDSKLFLREKQKLKRSDGSGTTHLPGGGQAPWEGWALLFATMSSLPTPLI